MTPLDFEVEDPRATDVVDLLQAHLNFAHETTPTEHIHALDIERLCQPGITFFTARQDGKLVGIGALNELTRSQAELKSMHVNQLVRGKGLGRAFLHYLLTVAGDRQYQWLGLETGTMDAFAPARHLYLSVGFTSCEPFGEYSVNDYSTCMSMNPMMDVITAS
jgi:putative acetyltransferase